MIKVLLQYHAQIPTKGWRSVWKRWASPYELFPFDTRKGEQHTPEFTAIESQRQRFPVIVERLARPSSTAAYAILLYLSGKDREVYTAWQVGEGARRDVVVADVRGLRHLDLTQASPVHFGNFAPEPKGIRRQPLHIRGAASLGHPRGAAGAKHRYMCSEGL